MRRSGIQAFLDILAACGVRWLFGNPGTTELPLVDALVDHPQIRYVLALQEVPALAMADGYAQASGGLGVVNLHTCCGLGNAMGMLYNAFREGTTLLVTAGQQDTRMKFEEPILWGDMVAVVRPWTKYAAEVSRVEEMPSAVRRAVQAALTPPTGPTFLSLPLDVQQAEAELDLAPPCLPDPQIPPVSEAVRRAAAVLARARNPGILVGCRIAETSAVEPLVRVAELLGAPAMHEAATSHGRAGFPAWHPLCGPPLPFWSPEVRQRLAEFDVLLVAGMKLMQQYIYHEPPRPIPEHIRLVQIDDDPRELGKNYPPEVAVWGHPRVALEQLADRLKDEMTTEEVAAAKRRADTWARRHQALRDALRDEAQAQFSVRPLTPLCLMESVARALPADVAVVEESATTTGGYLERTGTLRDPQAYFAQRGWALGWGLNCAIGVKLAWPDRPVLALLGDGAALYGIQGLWTAAHYGIAVTFVVANNAQYKILKECAEVLKLPQAAAGRYVGLDLVDPRIDYVGLARAFGVAAERVEHPDQLSEAVREGLAGAVPRLIEVPIAA